MILVWAYLFVFAATSNDESVSKVSRRLTADAELKYYQYASDGSGNKLSLSDKARRFQVERQAKSSTVYIGEFEKNVLFSHFDPEVDTEVSGRISTGQLYEEKSVIAMAKHIEMILDKSYVPIGEQVWRGDVQPGRFGFIDIGANVGVYTVSLGAILNHRTPITLFAFEPTTETMSILASSLRQNNISNAYLYPYGLTDSGDIGEKASFVIDEKNKGHNHLKGDQSWSQNDGETVDIETATLDGITEMFRDHYPAMYDGWSNALWLKMDTEGLEPTVIRGGLKSLFSNSDLDPCFIKTEFKEHKERIYKLLSDVGYQIVDFDWNSIAQQKRVPPQQAFIQEEWDAIFAKKDSLECVRRKVDKFKSFITNRHKMDKFKSLNTKRLEKRMENERRKNIWWFCSILMALVFLFYAWNNRHKYYPTSWHRKRH